MLKNTKRPIMEKSILLSLCFLLFFSCKKEEPEDPFSALYDKFNGQYAHMFSISERAVDLNMDGSASNDLVSENREIANSTIVIRVYTSNVHLFVLGWPVENIFAPRGVVLDTTRFDPSYHIVYSRRGNDVYFKFSDDFKSTTFSNKDNVDPLNTLIYFESIAFEESESIRVISYRKLFTMNGWVRTRIVSLFKRFTKIT
jgi:hypothetical protein